MLTHKKNPSICLPVFLALFFIACSIGNEKVQKPDYNYEEALLKYIAALASSPQPDIFIHPEDGSRNVAPDTRIIFYFTNAVDKNGDWMVTIDTVVYTRKSTVIEWSENCFDNDCYPVLILCPEEPYPQAKTVSVTAGEFLTENRLVRFNPASTIFTIAE